MPRKAPGNRGGPRQGTPGTAYGNRTDLNEAKPLPAQATKGQEYGAATQQMAAQQAVPMAPPQQPTGMPPAFPDGAVKAGSMGDLLGPPDDLSEPVTAGAALGAGPGPEALGLVNPELDVTRRDYQALQPYVPAFVFHASRAGASPSYVSWVQRLLAGA